MTVQSGTIDEISFTSGGAGNQWTTIDGVRYATWWDCRSQVGRNIKRGAQVTFTSYRRKLHQSMVEGVLCADILSATLGRPA